MRKYRNGKKSQRIQGDNRYSESYLEYSHARGSRSVKSIVFDTDGNGDVDTILKAWRHPAVRKGNYFDSSTDQSTIPLGAEHAPTNISLIVPPESAPTGVSVTAPPQVAPTNISVLSPPQVAPTGVSVTAPPQVAPTGISVTAPPQVAPTGISVTVPPQVAPTGITLNLDRDEDGVYADADFDDNDDQVGSVIPPTSPPTNISVTTKPSVAPTGISILSSPQFAPTNISIFSPNSSAMVAGVYHEFDAVLSTGFMRTNPNNQNTQWQHYEIWRNTTLGLELVADYVAPTFESGSQYSTDPGSLTHSIRPIGGGEKVHIQTDQTLSPNWLIQYGAYVDGTFQAVGDKITLSRTGQDWEYNIVAPQVAPTGISADIPVSTILIYHGMGGVLDSSSRTQTNVPTDGSVWTDISASNSDNGLHYNPHIIVPTFPNAVQYVLTLTNDTTSNNAGLFNRTSGIHPAGGPAPTYTFFDNTNSVAKLTGQTVIRINWYDSNGNTVADEALLRITLV